MGQHISWKFPARQTPSICLQGTSALFLFTLSIISHIYPAAFALIHLCSRFFSAHAHKPVCLPRPSTPQWSIRGWFYGLSPPTDSHLAVLTQTRTICYCKCLSNTFRLFALTAHRWKTGTVYGKLWQFIALVDQWHIREIDSDNEMVVKVIK